MVTIIECNVDGTEHKYGTSERETLDGMFLKYLGFILRIVVEKSPQKAFVQSRPFKKNAWMMIRWIFCPLHYRFFQIDSLLEQRHRPVATCNMLLILNKL